LTVEELPSARALAGKSTVERELVFVRPRSSWTSRGAARAPADLDADPADE
jgi:hypothetical protein